MMDYHKLADLDTIKEESDYVYDTGGYLTGGGTPIIQTDPDEFQNGNGYNNFDVDKAAFSIYDKNQEFDTPKRIDGSPKAQITSPGYQPSNSPFYIPGGQSTISHHQPVGFSGGYAGYSPTPTVNSPVYRPFGGVSSPVYSPNNMAGGGGGGYMGAAGMGASPQYRPTVASP